MWWYYIFFLRLAVFYVHVSVCLIIVYEISRNLIDWTENVIRIFRFRFVRGYGHQRISHKNGILFWWSYCNWSFNVSIWVSTNDYTLYYRLYSLYVCIIYFLSITLLTVFPRLFSSLLFILLSVSAEDEDVSELSIAFTANELIQFLLLMRKDVSRFF